MTKGDIVLLPFPFTDLVGSKKCPALVLIAEEMDVTVAFITTQLKREVSSDVFINPSQINGLKKDSIIRLNKIATIDRSLIIGLLGNLNDVEIESVNKSLRKLLDL